MDIPQEGKGSRIRPLQTPRAGWDDEFAAMSLAGDDELLDAECQSPTQWELEEWEW